MRDATDIANTVGRYQGESEGLRRLILFLTQASSTAHEGTSAITDLWQEHMLPPLEWSGCPPAADALATLVEIYLQRTAACHDEVMEQAYGRRGGAR